MKHTRFNDSLKSVYEKEHFVQYYPEESRLIANLVRFIGGGIVAHDPCIVIATQEHCQELVSQLYSRNLDIDGQIKKGNFILLDARQTLDSFMENGMPDKDLFGQNIGKILRELSAQNKPIRAFGEMVAILWEEQSEASAVMLEQYWNEISRQFNLTLYCAYPAIHSKKADHTSMLDRVSRLHTSVLFS